MATRHIDERLGIESDAALKAACRVIAAAASALTWCVLRPGHWLRRFRMRRRSSLGRERGERGEGGDVFEAGADLDEARAVRRERAFECRVDVGGALDAEPLRAEGLGQAREVGVLE